ncbi:MAG: hypothetical protein GEU74_05435 [Nitriliruptorales bacterium]|nr:hypothetical protein [Nitriliruptorales bacterium]
MPDIARADSPAVEGIPTLHSLDELLRLVRPGVFVRYSKGPEDDDGSTSRDYESGLDLPGLSVNPLCPELWWTRPLDEWLARQICNYAHLKDDSDDERRAWILSGDPVGRGPDNEPLVREFTPLAWVSDDLIHEAKRLYEARFEVAKDSTGG